MKVKRKGKVYPSSSPSSSSSSPPPSRLPSSSSYKDPDSVLKLLPVTILALALSLPNPDREVLAYLIARSILMTTSPNPSSLIKQHPKTKCSIPSKKNNKNSPKVAIFECGCFDCYTRFWYRWDSSPNRDFIHQVIEAFEDHLVQNESTKKHSHSKGKRRGKVMKTSHFESDFSVIISEHEKEHDISVPETECQVLVAENRECGDGEMKDKGFVLEEEKVGENLEMEMATVQFAGMSNHKGLARKVLPDLVGLLNSRFWSLWSPWI